MTDNWPYNLPIFRRHHRAVSPNAAYVAQINPAHEMSMSSPTTGLLCISHGPHISGCSPSFIWSDDSRYLAVPQFTTSFGFFTRSRLVVIAMHERAAYASKPLAWHIQLDTFAGGQLVATLDPFGSKRPVEFRVPGDFGMNLKSMHVSWPVSA